MSVGVGRMFEAFCLSVCSITQKRMIPNVQTKYREWLWDILEVTWFGGWKVTKRSRLGYRNMAWFRTLISAFWFIHLMPKVWLLQFNKDLVNSLLQLKPTICTMIFIHINTTSNYLLHQATANVFWPIQTSNRITYKMNTVNSSFQKHYIQQRQSSTQRMWHSIICNTASVQMIKSALYKLHYAYTI